MTRYKILYTLKHFIRYFIHMDFFFIADISGSQLWGLSFAKVLTDLFKKLYPPLHWVIKYMAYQLFIKIQFQRSPEHMMATLKSHVT